MMKAIETLSLSDPEQLKVEEARLKDDRITLHDGGGEVDHPQAQLISGLYNLGTGNARSFNDLVKSDPYKARNHRSIKSIENETQFDSRFSNELGLCLG